MAGQSIVFKTLNLIGAASNKILFANRTVPLINVHPAATLRKDIKAKAELLPVRPTKPQTPFLRFLMDQRPSILKENPNLKLVDVAKICGEKWRSADTNVKYPYIEAYNKELSQFKVLNEKYKNSLTEEQKCILKEVRVQKKADKEHRQRRKLNREFGKPKPPVNPNILYMMDKSKQLNKPIKEMFRDSQNAYKDLSPEEKQKYESMYEKAKVAYEKQLLEWEMKMIREGHYDLVRNKTIKEKVPHSVRKEISEKKSKKSSKSE